MTDYSEQGATPVEDAAIDDPPTVDDVIQRQRREYPEQARTAPMDPSASAEERAAATADAHPTDQDAAGRPDVEDPDSA